MKIMLVIYDPSKENEILKDRIRRLGKSYVFGGNHWLIKTHLSAKEVCKKITENEFENMSIFVTQINPTPGDGYWGMMNKSIWSWLKEK